MLHKLRSYGAMRFMFKDLPSGAERKDLEIHWRKAVLEKKGYPGTHEIQYAVAIDLPASDDNGIQRVFGIIKTGYPSLTLNCLQIPVADSPGSEVISRLENPSAYFLVARYNNYEGLTQKLGGLPQIDNPTLRVYFGGFIIDTTDLDSNRKYEGGIDSLNFHAWSSPEKEDDSAAGMIDFASRVQTNFGLTIKPVDSTEFYQSVK